MKKHYILFTLLCSCSVGPDYEPPKIEIPPSFQNTSENIEAVPPKDDSSSEDEDRPKDQQVAPEPLNIGWWKNLNDPTVQEIFASIDNENLTLKQQEARLEQARALRREVIFNMLPEIRAEAGYTDSKVSAGRFPGASPSFRQYKLYSVGALASWEIDIFGGVRRQYEANDALVAAQEEGVKDAKRIMMLEGARMYFTLLAAKSKLRIISANILNQEETLKLTQSMLQFGVASDFDIARSELQVSRTKAILPRVHADIENLLQNLGVLVGGSKSLLPEIRERALSEIIESFGKIKLSAPEAIIKNRPDIKRAESILISKNAEIGVATAQLFPRITVDGSFSLEAPNISDFHDTQNSGRVFGPSISWAFLDIGRVVAQQDAAKASFNEEVASFKEKVISALASIESSLVNFKMAKEALIFYRSAKDAGLRAEGVSRERYKIGASDLLSVLDAERERLRSELDLIDSELAFVESIIRVLAEVTLTP